MRTVAETRQKALDYMVEWIVLLGMGHWNMRHNFNERKDIANSQADPKYHEGLIKFNTKEMRRLPDWEFEETVIHELVHCLLWELSGDYKKKTAREMVDEQTTTQIARALMRAKYNKLNDLGGEGDG